MDVEAYRKRRYRGIDQRIVNRRELKIMQKIFASIQEDTISILDVPCGYGRFSELLLKRSLNLTSADISLPMVLTAREYSPRSHSNHQFLVGDIKHLPLKDNSFDCIVTIRLFQHIVHSSSRFEILKELHRVTKKFVILSFYRYNLLHMVERWVRCRIKNVNKRISMLPFAGLLRESNLVGFKVLNLFPVIRYFHAHNIILLTKIQP